MSIKQQVNKFTNREKKKRKEKNIKKKRIKEQVLEQHRKSIKMSQHKKATLKWLGETSWALGQENQVLKY